MSKRNSLFTRCEELLTMARTRRIPGISSSVGTIMLEGKRIGEMFTIDTNYGRTSVRVQAYRHVVGCNRPDYFLIAFDDSATTLLVYPTYNGSGDSEFRDDNSVVVRVSNFLKSKHL